MCDSTGVISTKRSDLDAQKQRFARDVAFTNLEEALVGADVFVGLSKGNIVSKSMIASMAPKAVVFALATPAPEITFQFDEKAEHYFAIEIPLSTPNINGYKAIMADYAQKFYASNKLTVTGNMLNPETQLLMTKSFKKLTDAQDFMSTFALNNNEVKEIHEKQFQYFLISKQNYVQLFKIKSLDSYKKFYQENYPK